MPARALALSLVLPTLALAAVGASAPAASAATGPTCHGVRATIVGTATSDRLIGTSGRDVIVGLRGNDTIEGRGGDDLLCGGKGSDRLVGGAGDDALHGGDAQRVPRRHGPDFVRGDLLEGGAGDDLLDAGVEYGRRALIRTSDTVSFAHAPGPVTVDLSARSATGDGEDRIVRARRLAVVGSAHDDRLSGSRFREVLDGRRGDDVLTGRDGADVLLDGAGDDSLSGGPGDDLVISLRGEDTVAGDDGRDELIAASPGTTSVQGGNGFDFVWRWFTPGETGLLDGGPGGNYLELLAQFDPDATTEATLDRAAGTAVAHSDAATTTASFSAFRGFALEGGPAWTYVGTDEPDAVQVMDGPIDASTFGGDDIVFGDVFDDRVDGGDGVDVVVSGGGRDTCLNVEQGDCASVAPQPARARARAIRAVRALSDDVRRLVSRYVPGAR